MKLSRTGNLVRVSGVLAAAVLLIGTLALAPVRAEQEPRRIIDQYSQQVLSLLSDPALRADGDLDPLIARLSEELDPIIAYRQMAIRSLGPKARDLEEAEIDRFVGVFRPFVKRVYVGQIVSYLFEGSEPWSIEGIEVVDQQTRYEGRYALVKSVVHARQGDVRRDFNMNFKMINQDGDWGVYDLTFEDFSLVGNYRSQFSSVLANDSLDGLIKRLRRKLEDLREGSTDASDEIARAGTSS